MATSPEPSTHEAHALLLAELAADPAIAEGDIGVALRRIARAGALALDADRVNLWLFDESRTLLRCECNYDRASDSYDVLPALQGAAHPHYFELLGQSRAFAASHARADARLRELHATYLAEHRIEALVDAPIRARGAVAGVVCAERRTVHEWRAEQIALLATLGDFASLVLASAANRQTERALRARSDQLDLILGHAQAVIFTLDRNGRFEYISPSVGQFSRTGPNDVIGDAWQTVVHPDDLPRIIAQTERLFRGEAERVSLDYRVRDQQGNYRVLSATVTLMRGADGRRHVVGSALEVTAVRAAEARRAGLERELQAVQRHQALGRLAGGIAHEFNNLLTIVLGGAELLAVRAPLDDADRDVLRRVHDATTRASRFTRQLLAFSGRQLLDLQRVDVAEVLAELLPLLRGTVPSSVRLTVVPPPSLAAVRIDRAALEQAIVEIVLRAVHAMPNGGEIELRFDEATCDAPRRVRSGELPAGRYVRVRVEDSGEGPTEEQLRATFEPFADAGAADPRVLERQLRLAAAFGSVSQQHGYVDAEAIERAEARRETSDDLARVLRGTRFTIWLPVDSAATTEPSIRAPAREPAATRVLVVEDEPDVLDLATLVLRDSGYLTEGEQHVEVALRRVENQHEQFDLLVTDLVMPGLDGVRLYRRLREALPELRVLYMSGYAPDDVPTNVTPSAITCYLQKPFTLAHLRQKVQEALGGDA